MTSADGPAGTFLLGVGCQKGGTAWMHRYLESSPQCDPGFRKEYHVWDALDLPSGRLARDRIENQGGRRADFLHDPDHYFDYFSGLVAPGRARLTADITPAYAGLSPDRLRFVRAGFEARGVRPVRSRNTLAKALWLSNPTSVATRTMDWPLSVSISAAASSRARRR